LPEPDQGFGSASSFSLGSSKEALKQHGGGSGKTVGAGQVIIPNRTVRGSLFPAYFYGSLLVYPKIRPIVSIKKDKPLNGFQEINL